MTGFYIIWGIIIFLSTLIGILYAGWEEERKKHKLIIEVDDTPDIYIRIMRKNKFYRIVLFTLGAIAYTGAIIGVHIYLYGYNLQQNVQIEDIVKQSFSILIILVAVTSTTREDKFSEESTDDFFKETLKVIRKLLNSIRTGVYKLSINSEKKSYKKFVRQQVQRISASKELTHFFILKVIDTSWEKILQIPYEEYSENIGDKLIRAYIEGARLQEVVINMCNKEFLDLGCTVIQIVDLFNYCREENMQSNKSKYNKRIKELVNATEMKVLRTEKLKVYNANTYIAEDSKSSVEVNEN